MITRASACFPYDHTPVTPHACRVSVGDTGRGQAGVGVGLRARECSEAAKSVRQLFESCQVPKPKRFQKQELPQLRWQLLQACIMCPKDTTEV